MSGGWLKNNAIKVAIVEDHSMFRNSLAALLNQKEGIQVIFDTENGIQMFRELKKHRPDIMFMDYRLPGKNGLTLTKEVLESYPDIKIVILSSYDSESLVLHAISEGACGYISKFEDISEIFNAIEKVHTKGYYFSEKVENYMIDNLKAQANAGTGPTFSPEIQISETEQQVMQLMSEEMTSKEIAAELNKSIRSIDNCKKNIMSKTGATNAIGIIMHGIRNGIIRVDPTEKKKPKD